MFFFLLLNAIKAGWNHSDWQLGLTRDWSGRCVTGTLMLLHPWLMLHALDRQLIGWMRHVGLAAREFQPSVTAASYEYDLVFYENRSPGCFWKHFKRVVSYSCWNLSSFQIDKGQLERFSSTSTGWSRFICIKMGIGRIFGRAAIFKCSAAFPGCFAGALKSLDVTQRNKAERQKPRTDKWISTVWLRGKSSIIFDQM